MIAKNKYDSYRYAHDIILYLTKSFIEAIDITSMEIDRIKEILNYINHGTDKHR